MSIGRKQGAIGHCLLDGWTDGDSDTLPESGQSQPGMMQLMELQQFETELQSYVQMILGTEDYLIVNVVMKSNSPTKAAEETRMEEEL